MSKLHPVLDDDLRAFIGKQPLFFVATAPTAGGHVNLSPKGLESFRVTGDTTVAYLDYAGSGAETIAHLRENGRIVIMMCAFSGPPKILRLYGRGQALEPGDPAFAELRGQFPPEPPARAIIRVSLDRISTSCGYGVPLMKLERPRKQLVDWCDRKGPAGLERYQRDHNARSIDGLPALRAGLRLAERKSLVDVGTSGRVHDERSAGKNRRSSSPARSRSR